MDKSKAGYIVTTKTGKLGRTYHYRGLINCKVPVFLADEIKQENGIEVPITYSDRAMLCDSKTIKITGFID